MPSAIEQWLITGKVIDETTEQSGCGFEVRIYDKDISDDQHLGTTYTDELGCFKFTFSLADFEDNYWRFWGIHINFGASAIECCRVRDKPLCYTGLRQDFVPEGLSTAECPVRSFSAVV